MVALIGLGSLGGFGGSDGGGKAGKTAGKAAKPVDINKTLARSAQYIKEVRTWVSLSTPLAHNHPFTPTRTRTPQGKYKRAAIMLERAVEQHPDSTNAWLNLGIARRKGDGAAGVLPAVTAFRKASVLAPTSAEPVAYMASALSCTKELTEAREAAFRALAIEPKRVDALVLGSKLTNFSDPDQTAAGEALVDKMRSILAANDAALDRQREKEEKKQEMQESQEGDGTGSVPEEESPEQEEADSPQDRDLLSPSEEVRLRFGLFKALDELDEPSAAARQLVAANMLKMDLQALLSGSKRPVWGKEATLNLLVTLIMAFPPVGGTEHEDGTTLEAGEAEEVSNENCTALGAPRSLSIVGLPRSGSTLLQHMLAAHPAIAAGDEYTLLGESIQTVVQAKVKAKSGTADQVEVLRDPEAALEIQTRYHKGLAAAAGIDQEDKKKQKDTAATWFSKGKGKSEKPQFVIDKQLSNAWWLGTLGPCDRAIALERDDMDVGFSSFKTDFSSPGYEFTYDQEELGWRIRLTRFILDHWRVALPENRLLRLRYSDLIRDPEATMRRTLDFLGLEFHEDCTHPEKSDMVVATASSLQLRQPIDTAHPQLYSGHWQRYASVLEPLMLSLAAADEWLKTNILGITSGSADGQEEPEGATGEDPPSSSSASSSSSSPAVEENTQEGVGAGAAQQPESLGSEL